MFERFTDRARVAVARAQTVARELHYGYVGTQHVLLGLSEGDGVAARALRQSGFDRARFESALIASVAPEDAPPTGHLPFTPRSKQALEAALRQALTWGHNYIGTEHLVVGLLRDDGALATKLLAEQGITPGEIQRRVLQLLAASDLDLPAPVPDAVPDEVLDDVVHDLVGLAMETGPTTVPDVEPGVEPARCPGCRAPLAEHLGADLIPAVGAVERVFAVAYCRACGHTLAVLPDG